MKIAQNNKEGILIIPECNEDLTAFAQILKAQQISEIEKDGKLLAIQIKKVYD